MGLNSYVPVLTVSDHVYEHVYVFPDHLIPLFKEYSLSPV